MSLKHILTGSFLFLIAISWLAPPAHPRVLVDPDYPTHLLYESAPGQTSPYHHLGKSAYILLGEGIDAEEYIRDAKSDGFNTLRIFLTVHWPPDFHWIVNPWKGIPGEPPEIGDPDKPWWAEFDEGPGGYWDRLDQVLKSMDRKGMVANLCIFDHATLTFLEGECRSQGARFLVHPGTPLDDGRLNALLDRLARALRPHENYYLEIGNQIARAWYRPGSIGGLYPHPYKFAPGGDHPPTCVRWMGAVARRMLTKLDPERPPLITNSARYREDRAFTPAGREDWCHALSFHSIRSPRWYRDIRDQLSGPPGFNRGFVETFGKPVIDNEPMTDAAPERFGVSDPDPVRHRIHSWLTAMAGGYKTYHSDPSIRCIPNRRLPPGSEAGKAYVPPFRRFWIDSGLPVRELEPSPELISGAPPACSGLARANPDRSRVVLYLLGRLEPGAPWELDLPGMAYQGVWLDPATGREVAIEPGPARPLILTVPPVLAGCLDGAVRLIGRRDEAPPGSAQSPAPGEFPIAD